MTDPNNLWAGFLYGVNIPGGVWLKPEHVETRLRTSFAGLAYVKCAGDADNLLIETIGQAEDTLASRLEALLGVKGAVVISLDRLRSVYATARARLVARGLPGKAPFVIAQDGAEWEFGLVLSSIDLPADATFPAAKNARALEVIERRALLAQKRRVTDAGKRIMWGGTVIEPLRSHLGSQGRPTGCLTSRALARLQQVITAADSREHARRALPTAVTVAGGSGESQAVTVPGSEARGAASCDLDTEIASDFTVGRYWEIRPRLDAACPDQPEWDEIRAAFRRRIQERFLKPIRELARHDRLDESPTRPGFAILALDCLLIDTIQAFRQGRVGTGDVSPAKSFKEFLRSPRFSSFSSKDREDFFSDVRNGLLHNGETRGGWKIRIDTPGMITKNPKTQTRTINRRRFHAAIVGEFRDYCRDLEEGPPAVRERFLCRMDAICGWTLG